MVHVSETASAGDLARLELVNGWLLVCCWLVAGWLLVGCWWVAGGLLVGCWLVSGWLFSGCWLVAGSNWEGGRFLAGCWLVAGWALVFLARRDARAARALRDSRVVVFLGQKCCQLAQNGIWNPDVLLHDVLGMFWGPSGSWSTSLARPVRVIKQA